jgi:hypothetical protein
MIAADDVKQSHGVGVQDLTSEEAIRLARCFSSVDDVVQLDFIMCFGFEIDDFAEFRIVVGEHRGVKAA